MKKALGFAAIALCASLGVGGSAWAAQPNQSCETTGSPPGSSSSASGSAFKPDGTAGSHYAGEQPQNSGNPKSVSQYDVACSKQP